MAGAKHALVSRLLAGPPQDSPFNWLDPIADVHEILVLREAVRCGTPRWSPRPLV